MRNVFEKSIGYVKHYGIRAFIEIAVQKILRKKTYRIHLPGLTHSVAFRVGTDDLTVLQQLFGNNELDVPLEDQPSTILDAGGNVGYAALYFHRRFPQAQIISVEPEASNIAMHRLNCAAYPQIQLVEGGVWPRSAYLRITNASGRKDGFRVEENEDGKEGDIRAYSIGEILDTWDIGKIDLLKVDIEGAEKELFSENTDDWLSRVKVVMVELHDRFKPGCKESVFGALEAKAYRTAVVGEYHVFYLEAL